MNVHTFFGILLMLCLIGMIFSSFVNIKYQKYEFLIMNTIFVLIFIIFAYTYNPPDHFDLYRYFLRMEGMQNKQFSDIIFYGRNALNPTMNFLMYLVSQTSNFNLLSPISIILIFSIIIIISYKSIYESGRKIYSSSYNLYLYLVISVLGISLLLSGIRQNTAWSFMLIAVYYDFFSKKDNVYIKILLYIFPMTIHTSAIIIPAVRLFTSFLKKRPRFSFFILLWPLVIRILMDFVNFLPSIVQEALFVLNYYLTLDTGFTSTIIYSQLYIILLVIVFYLYLTDKSLNNNFLFFYISILLFGLSSVTITTLTSRILDFSIVISLPLVTKVFSLRRKTSLLLKSILFISGSLVLIFKDIYPFLISLR